MLKDFGIIIAFALVAYTMVIVGTMDRKIDKECHEHKQKVEEATDVHA